MVAMWLTCALVLVCVVAAKGATLPGMNHHSQSPASQGVRVKGTGPGVGQHAEMQKLTQHNEMLLQKLRQSASVHSKLKDELLVVDALSRDVSGLRHSLGHVNSDESTSDALSLSQRKVQSVESVQLLDPHELGLAIEATAPRRVAQMKLAGHVLQGECFTAGGETNHQEEKMGTTIPQLVDAIVGGEWQRQITVSSTRMISDARAGALRVAPLRIDWANLKPRSPLSKQMHAALSLCVPEYDCSSLSAPELEYVKNRRCGGSVSTNIMQYGMAADLHIWGEDLCQAMVLNSSLKTPTPWLWKDESLCSDQTQGPGYTHGNSALSCYFGHAHQACSALPLPRTLVHNPAMGGAHRFCPLYKYTDMEERKAWRAAVTETLFTSINPKIVHMAKRLSFETFGPKGAPEDLILIHIRWGDKFTEMPDQKVVSINHYFNLAVEVVNSNNIKEPTVFLATDNVNAINEFLNIAPKHWKIVWDPTVCSKLYTKHLIGREKEQAVSCKLAAKFKGALGTLQLVALVLGMDAKYFLLTLCSNWSRMMDELRRSVIDPYCEGSEGSCSEMHNVDSAGAKQCVGSPVGNW